MIPNRPIPTNYEAGYATNFFIRMASSGVQVTPGRDASYFPAVAEGFVSFDPVGLGTYLYWWDNTPELRQLAVSTNDPQVKRFYDWLLAANVVYGEQANNRSPLTSVWGTWPAVVTARPPKGDNIATVLGPEILRKMGAIGGASVAFAVDTVDSPINPAVKIPKAWVVSDSTDPSSGVRTLVYNPGGSPPATTLRGGGNPVAPVPQTVPGIQLLVTREAPPSPGDGVNFATVAWRLIDVAPGSGWKAAGNWQKWTGGFAHRTNNPEIAVLFVDDVLYEARNFQGVPGRLAPMWDATGLEAALALAGQGTPPPPVAAPAETPPSQIRAAVPSGSIPIPDGITDIAVPPPPPLPGPNDLRLPTGGGRGPQVTPDARTTIPTPVATEPEPPPAPAAPSGPQGEKWGVPTWLLWLGLVAGAVALLRKAGN